MTKWYISPGDRLTSKEVQSLKKLRVKKHRDEAESFLAEGGNFCRDALESGHEIDLLICDINRTEDFSAAVGTAEERNIPVKFALTKQFSQFSSTVTPSGIAVLIPWKRETISVEEAVNYRNILILDGIHDPGNLGTLLRTAEWFGVRAVICGTGTADVTNPKVVRGSMGAILQLRIWENVSIPAALPGLKSAGFVIAGTDSSNTESGRKRNPEALQEFSRTALILGSEALGMAGELKKLCDTLITIPAQGKTESLNVAVAGGIALYFISRAGG